MKLFLLILSAAPVLANADAFQFIPKVSYVVKSKTNPTTNELVEWSQDLGRMTYQDASNVCYKLNASLPTREDVSTLIYQAGGEYYPSGFMSTRACYEYFHTMKSVKAERFKIGHRYKRTDNPLFVLLDGFDDLSPTSITHHWIENNVRKVCQPEILFRLSKDEAGETFSQIGWGYPRGTIEYQARCVRRSPNP